MGKSLLRTAFLIALASAFPAAGRRDSFKEEMRFGAEAAQQGLWREAMFRWERIVKDHPDDAHLRNNLGVAYESLGLFERARAEYEAARRLDPGNKEIRDNFESFQEMCKSVKGCGGEAASAGATAGASPSPPPGATPSPTPAASPAPSVSPVPSPFPGPEPAPGPGTAPVPEGSSTPLPTPTPQATPAPAGA